MDGIVAYLTTAEPTLGSLGWLFFIFQLLGVAAGAYLTFAYTSRNSARYTFMRQLGIALLILCGVGIVLGVLRMLDVPFVNQRLWFWVQAIIQLGVVGYVIYYMRTILPGLEKAAAGRRPQRPITNNRQIATEPATDTPRPVATTTRREARRDKKRKNK
jgi:hypothetical protein